MKDINEQHESLRTLKQQHDNEAAVRVKLGIKEDEEEVKVGSNDGGQAFKQERH